MTRTGSPPSLLPTLPGYAYTDAAVFAAEQRELFESTWICAARAADLAPGGYRTVQIGRESVLLTRSRDGGVHAFFNVCRHRGARLRTDASGSAGRALRCPYHAWTYDL